MSIERVDGRARHHRRLPSGKQHVTCYARLKPIDACSYLEKPASLAINFRSAGPARSARRDLTRLPLPAQPRQLAQPVGRGSPVA